VWRGSRITTAGVPLVVTGTLPVTTAGVEPAEGGGEAGSVVEPCFEHAERMRADTIARAHR